MKLYFVLSSFYFYKTVCEIYCVHLKYEFDKKTPTGYKRIGNFYLFLLEIMAYDVFKRIRVTWEGFNNCLGGMGPKMLNLRKGIIIRLEPARLRPIWLFSARFSEKYQVKTA